MSVELIAAFWAVSALFVLTPGADWAYAITAGLRNRSPLPAVLGMLTGHLLATLVVAAGVGVVVSRYPVVLTGVTVLGALYLLWLGLGLVFRPTSGPSASEEPAGGSTSRQLAKGLAVSGLNPKVFLLFLALLPQFTDPAGPWPVGVQMGLLGLVHLISCAAVYLTVGYGARRVLRARPTAARVVTRVSGAAMIAIGVFLVAEKLLL